MCTIKGFFQFEMRDLVKSGAGFIHLQKIDNCQRYNTQDSIDNTGMRIMMEFPLISKPNRPQADKQVMQNWLAATSAAQMSCNPAAIECVQSTDCRVRHSRREVADHRQNFTFASTWRVQRTFRTHSGSVSDAG